MTDHIENGLLQKWPNELTECQIIKEYLIETQQEMWKEIHQEEDRKGVPNHIRNIIVIELTRRKKLIDHLLKIEIDKYWELKKKHNIA